MSGFGVISPESKGKVFFLQSHMVALMFNCHKVGFFGVVFFFFLKSTTEKAETCLIQGQCSLKSPECNARNVVLYEKHTVTFKINKLIFYLGP